MATCCMTQFLYLILKCVFIDFRERRRRRERNNFLKFIDFREKEGERDIDLFHLFKHSLVDFCMCPGWISNPQL